MARMAAWQVRRRSESRGGTVYLGLERQAGERLLVRLADHPSPFGHSINHQARWVRVDATFGDTAAIEHLGDVMLGPAERRDVPLARVWRTRHI